MRSGGRNWQKQVRDSTYSQRAKGTGFRFRKQETVDKRLNHSEPQVPPQSKGTAAPSAAPLSGVCCEVWRSLRTGSSLHRAGRE